MSDGFLCVCTCAQQDEYLYWSAISFSLQGVESEEARRVSNMLHNTKNHKLVSNEKHNSDRFWLFYFNADRIIDT